MDSQKLSLTASQLDILHKITAAAEALPETPVFECRRINQYPFAWVIHLGFGKDVVTAAWEDIEALDKQGFIDMVSDDPDDCTFRLTDKKPTFESQSLVASEESGRGTDDTNTYEIDAE